MKKILMIAYTNYLTDARPRREAETLAGRGDKVDFISLSERNHTSQETVNGVNVMRLSTRRYRGGSSFFYILSYLSFFFRAFVRVALLHLEKRYDVVHVHTMPDFMVFVGLIPKLMGARIVLDVHDMMPELYMSKFDLPETHPLTRLLKFEEWLSLHFADRVICVHDPHKELLARRSASRDRITVLLNVPDPRIFAGNLDGDIKQSGQCRIIYHGTIAQRLGLDFALESFALVVSALPQVKFEILGDGDFADALEIKIKQLKLGSSVIFNRQFFQVEDVPGFVRGATVGVIPNRRDLATEYMLPVKMLEYAQLGVAVVAPRLRTIQYYFNEDCAAFYNPGDVSDLADVLTQMLKDPARRSRLSRRARERMNELSWADIRHSLFEVIDN